MDKNGIKQYRLSPEEIEEVLKKNYGGKIQPVDTSREAIFKKRHDGKATHINKYTSHET